MSPKAHFPLKDANFRNAITSPQSCSLFNQEPLTSFSGWLPSTIVIKDAIIKLRYGKTKDWLPAGAKLQRGPPLSLLSRYPYIMPTEAFPTVFDISGQTQFYLALSFLNLIPNFLYIFPIFLQTYTPSCHSGKANNLLFQCSSHRSHPTASLRCLRYHTHAGMCMSLILLGCSPYCVCLCGGIWARPLIKLTGWSSWNAFAVLGHPPRLPKTKAHQTQRPPITFHTALPGVWAFFFFFFFLPAQLKGKGKFYSSSYWEDKKPEKLPDGCFMCLTCRN